MRHYLSYLMGADKITDSDLENLGVVIEGKTKNGDRMLKIKDDNLQQYIELIKAKLSNGFWNELVGKDEIIFIFKFNDGSIEQYTLLPETEQKIDAICADLNNESPDKTANVYKYISENDFYHDFMVKYYADMITR